MLRALIRRRLQGYRVVVARPDETLPARVPAETRAPRVAVIGAGIAGLSAATTLAERGIAVTVLEANAYVGGKLGSWPVTLPGGETAWVSHGFHAFFRHYYNLNAWLDGLNARADMAAIDDYAILGRDGSTLRFGVLDTTPVLNLLSMSRAGIYRLTDSLFAPQRDVMGLRTVVAVGGPGLFGVADVAITTAARDDVTLTADPALIGVAGADWWTLTHQPRVDAAISAHLLGVGIPLDDFVLDVLPPETLGRAGVERGAGSASYAPISGDDTRFSKTIDLGGSNDDVLEMVKLSAVPAGFVPGGLAVLVRDILGRTVVNLDGTGTLIRAHAQPLGVTMTDLVPGPAGGLYIIGTHSQDAYVARVGADFTVGWARRFGFKPTGAPNEDTVLSAFGAAAADGSGDIFVVGDAIRDGQTRTYALRIDDVLGDVVWGVDHDGGSGANFSDVVATSQGGGGLVATGTTTVDNSMSTGGIYVLALDNNGDLRFAKTLGHLGGGGVGTAVENHPAGGFIVALDVGKPINEATPPGGYLRIDTQGGLRWTRTMAPRHRGLRPEFSTPRDVVRVLDAVVSVGEVSDLSLVSDGWMTLLVENTGGGLGGLNSSQRPGGAPMSPAWWTSHGTDASNDRFNHVVDQGDGLAVAGTTNVRDPAVFNTVDAWVTTVPYEGTLPYRAQADLAGSYVQRMVTPLHETRLEGLFDPVEVYEDVPVTAVPLTVTPIDTVQVYPADTVVVGELAR